MAPYKPRHQIVCAHCGGAAGPGECPGCRRPICAGCAADPETCSRPRAWSIRLRLGERLRAIGPGAARGAVSRWRGRIDAVDLERGSRRPLMRRRWGSIGEARFAGLDSRGEAVAFDRFELDSPRAATLCPCGDHLVATRRDETVAVAGEIVDPLPRQVIERAAYDCAERLLAATTHGLLAAARIEGGEARRIGSVKLGGETPLWLATAAGRVALLTGWVERDGPRARLRVFRAGPRVFYPLPFYDWRAGEPGELRFRPFDSDPGDEAPLAESADRDQRLEHDRPRAALSADGRFVALGLAGARVAVHDLRRGELEIYGDHRGAIDRIGFGDGSRRLVSADSRRRIIVRERDGERFSRWLARDALSGGP
jgi:hypothetical protein